MTSTQLRNLDPPPTDTLANATLPDSTLDELMEYAILRLEADPTDAPSFTQIAEVARTRETTDRPRVIFIARMRSSGMGLRDLQRYLELTDRGGEAAHTECAAILLRHRAALRRKVAELRLALVITDFKIAHLEDHAGWTGIPDSNGADQ